MRTMDSGEGSAVGSAGPHVRPPSAHASGFGQRLMNGLVGPAHVVHGLLDQFRAIIEVHHETLRPAQGAQGVGVGLRVDMRHEITPFPVPRETGRIIQQFAEGGVCGVERQRQGEVVDAAGADPA